MAQIGAVFWFAFPASFAREPWQWVLISMGSETPAFQFCTTRWTAQAPLHNSRKKKRCWRVFKSALLFVQISFFTESALLLLGTRQWWGWVGSQGVAQATSNHCQGTALITCTTHAAQGPTPFLPFRVLVIGMSLTWVIPRILFGTDA